VEYFRGGSAVEVIALRVDTGEDVLQSLKKAVSEMQLAAGAVLSGSGVLEHFVLEVPAALYYPSPAYAIDKQGPGQIVSAQGQIASGDVELNVTIARRNELFAGRVMEGTKVAHTVELVLLRAGNTRWARTAHPTTGIPQLQAVTASPAGSVMLMGRPIDPNAAALVPKPLLQKHQCIPVARSEDTLVVAMADPSNPFAIDDLREATGLKIQTVGVPAKELLPALHQLLTGR
jgi:predicted DNA-binding protein with PD1-like motif